MPSYTSLIYFMLSVHAKFTAHYFHTQKVSRVNTQLLLKCAKKEPLSVFLPNFTSSLQNSNPDSAKQNQGVTKLAFLNVISSKNASYGGTWAHFACLRKPSWVTQASGAFTSLSFNDLVPGPRSRCSSRITDVLQVFHCAHNLNLSISTTPSSFGQNNTHNFTNKDSRTNRTGFLLLNTARTVFPPWSGDNVPKPSPLIHWDDLPSSCLAWIPSLGP